MSVDVSRQATSSPCHCDFPTVMDYRPYRPELWCKINPLSPTLLVVRAFYQSSRNENRTKPTWQRVVTQHATMAGDGPLGVESSKRPWVTGGMTQLHQVLCYSVGSRLTHCYWIIWPNNLSNLTNVGNTDWTHLLILACLVFLLTPVPNFSFLLLLWLLFHTPLAPLTSFYPNSLPLPEDFLRCWIPISVGN